MESADRSGRRGPRRFFQSIEVLLKNSALGARPEDETERKCEIAHIGHVAVTLAARPQ